VARQIEAKYDMIHAAVSHQHYETRQYETDVAGCIFGKKVAKKVQISIGICTQASVRTR
jgi:hypothetical protein